MSPGSSVTNVWATSSTSSASHTPVWYNWTTNNTDTGTWSNWNSTTTSTSTTACTTIIWSSWVDMSKEARDAREVQNKELVKKAKSIEDEKKKAEQRAKELLLDLIGEKELAIYNETGRLFVKGNKFDYIIQKRGYVKQISKDKITDLCVHLDNRYKFPETDNVIAIKMAIEADEDNILKLANKYGSCNKPKELLKAACM